MSNDQVSTSASVSQQPARWGDGKTVLVMLVGGPGAGKSTLAKLAGDQWTVVSETRGETRGEKASASLPSASLSVVRRFGGSVCRRPISLNLADGFNPLSQCAKMDC